MIEARLKALEMRSERLEAGFQRLEVRILLGWRKKLSFVAMKDDVARLEGRSSQVPTTWQIVRILPPCYSAWHHWSMRQRNFIAQKPVFPTAQGQPK